jgi:SAM-dependent methyltransferase
LRIARQRLDSPAFAAARGEQLPFADATFDLVVLDQVIEHVSDQSRVLAEAFRVLKPGGAMYVACPNYLRFYEPHYKIWFFPLLPKPLGALYLRLRGRDPILLKQLKYTTNRRVRKLLKRVQAEHVVDLNVQDFREKCSLESSGFASRKARLVQQLTRTLARCPGASGGVFLRSAARGRMRNAGHQGSLKVTPNRGFICPSHLPTAAIFMV